MYHIATRTALVLSLGLVAATARADEVSDALSAAASAYQAGNLRDTANQLALATAAVSAAQVARLNAFLPPAPAGLTATITEDYAKSFAMLGGGTGTEVVYADDSTSFKLDITVDSPIVAGMAPMLANAQMMAAMGKVDKIGDVMVLEQDQSLSALIDNRILVQMDGADVAVMMPVLQQLDFKALAGFDQPK